MRMNIGLIDADNCKKLDECFPNLVLMKLSAWHKSQGDSVEWYDHMKAMENVFTGGYYDKVYVSKVFSFSPDYELPIYADEVEYGGSGYCIYIGKDGKEHYNVAKDKHLPHEIEHIMPDYSLYGITDTAYGFMSRGCPRGCEFCHVAAKEGQCAYKVADLSEFWNGQKYIQLMDPNILACREWKDMLQQLIDSGAMVEFNQGLDIRMMTAEKAEMLKRIRVKRIHFAYDRWEDKEMIEPRFRTFVDATGWDRHKVMVYCLTNFNSTLARDLDRVMFIRSIRLAPYIMIYNKSQLKRGDIHFKLARWCNNQAFFWKYPTFEDYLADEKNTR